jgi:hypothetical protein
LSKLNVENRTAAAAIAFARLNQIAELHQRAIGASSVSGASTRGRVRSPRRRPAL